MTEDAPPLTPRGELVRDLVALLVHVLAELGAARAELAELEAKLEAETEWHRIPAGGWRRASQVEARVSELRRSSGPGGGWRSDPWLPER